MKLTKAVFLAYFTSQGKSRPVGQPIASACCPFATAIKALYGVQVYVGASELSYEADGRIITKQLPRWMSSTIGLVDKTMKSSVTAGEMVDFINRS